MLWKIVFWLLSLFWGTVVISILFAAYLFDLGFTAVDILLAAPLWLLQGMVLVGVFGLAYGRKYFTNKFWKAIFLIASFATLALIFITVLEGSYLELVKLPLSAWIAGTLVTIGELSALYVYGWKSMGSDSIDPFTKDINDY